MGEDGFDWSSFFDSLGGAGDPGGSPNTGGFDLSGIGGVGGPGDPGGPADFTSGLISNGDGTWTDPATGIVYDSQGISTGQTDPNYGGAVDNAGLGIGTGGGAGGGAAPGSSSGGGLSDLIRALGGPLGLASILGPLAGGLYAANRTNKATQQALAGIGNANTDIKNILGGPSPFAPYTAAGSAALGKLGGMNWAPLASQFGPLGSGAGIVGAVPVASTMRQIVARHPR